MGRQTMVPCLLVIASAIKRAAEEIELTFPPDGGYLGDYT